MSFKKKNPCTEEAFASPMQGFTPSGHRARPISIIAECLLANILCDICKYLFNFSVFTYNLCKYKKSASHDALSLHLFTKKYRLRLTPSL